MSITNETHCEHCGAITPVNTMFAGFCQTCLKETLALCEYAFNVLNTIVFDVEEDMVFAYWKRNRRDCEGRIAESTREDRFVCTRDGEWWFYDDVIETNDRGYVTQEDYDHNFFTCCSCDGVFHNMAERSCDYCGDASYCQDCLSSHHDYCDEREDESPLTLIHSWNYKPEAVFFRLLDEVPEAYYGCEIEIDGRGSMYSSNRNTAGQAFDEIVYDNKHVTYNKDDGSLRNYGFEVVTHPMSLKFVMHNREKFKKAFDTAIAEGYRAHQTDTCGLHVHVSRDAFTDEKSRNNFVFLFEKFYEQVLKFSRRTPENFERWANRYGIYNSDDTNKSFADKLQYAYRDKYRIVNVSHRRTLEVRAFRGTLNVDTFIATVQFMEVMRTLANSRDIAVNNLTWQSIVKLARVRKYNELTNYFIQRNLHNENTDRLKVYKQPPKRTVRLLDRFVVIGNSEYCRHYYAKQTVVEVVGYDNQNIITRFVSHPDGQVRNERQTIMQTDLAYLGEGDTPLSTYDVTLSMESAR